MSASLQRILWAATIALWLLSLVADLMQKPLSYYAPVIDLAVIWSLYLSRPIQIRGAS